MQESPGIKLIYYSHVAIKCAIYRAIFKDNCLQNFFRLKKLQILIFTNLSFHDVCDTETEFFLVVWLELKNMTFTLALKNESSTLYQNKQDEVIHEVSESDKF